MSCVYAPFAPGTAGSYRALRNAAAMAGVPFVDEFGWSLPDEQLLAAVRASRLGFLARGAEGLARAVRSGKVALGSRHVVGAMTWPEVVVLASVLRSSVGDVADQAGAA